MKYYIGIMDIVRTQSEFDGRAIDDDQGKWWGGTGRGLSALGKHQKTGGKGPVTVADFVDQIDYMAKLMGIDHVGIDSDLDGGGIAPLSFNGKGTPRSGRWRGSRSYN